VLTSICFRDVIIPRGNMLIVSWKIFSNSKNIGSFYWCYVLTAKMCHSRNSFKANLRHATLTELSETWAHKISLHILKFLSIFTDLVGFQVSVSTTEASFRGVRHNFATPSLYISNRTHKILENKVFATLACTFNVRWVRKYLYENSLKLAIFILPKLRYFLIWFVFSVRSVKNTF